MLEFLGPLIGGVGSAIGSTSSSSSSVPSADDFLSSYVDSMEDVYDDEKDFTKDKKKKEKKKSKDLTEESSEDQARLQQEIMKNYDTLVDSYLDAAMKGQISGEEALAKMEDLEAQGLFSPGSVINEKGDTSFSKKAAAEKKILEEIIPKQRQSDAAVLASTIMGRALTDQEMAYYSDPGMFKNTDDITSAMMLTEEGSMRLPSEDVKNTILHYGGKLVNPTSKNTENLPFKMRNTSATATADELSAISTAISA